MKFKLICVRSLARKRLLDIIMRTLMFLMCTTVFCFNTENSFSQEMVTIEKDQLVAADHVFKIIKKQTELNFVYPKNLFKKAPKIQLKKGNIKVSKLIDKVLGLTKFTFEITENNTIIINRPEKPKVTIQTKEVSGTITDKLGTPLPGANVIEKGTTNGFQADFDGNFTITTIGENPTLVFSYIGFATKEIVVNNQTNLTVVLEESAAGLDEVVVIGYGSVKKSDLTGSVSSIGTEAIENRPLANIADVFQGNSSGVAVTGGSGAPGSTGAIRIRGITSISGSVTPLYVVDGLPYTGDLNSINPYDIASIEILKDASSTAIYGSRGSNGVVLISTKKGVAGKLEFGYNTSMGIQEVIGSYDMLDSQQYAALRNDIAANEGLAIPFPADQIASLPNTNWQDVIFNSAIIQTHQIYARGGSEKVKFYLSANYVDQDGVQLESGFQRASITANVDANITDRLSIGNSITIGRQLIDGPDTFGGVSTNDGFRDLSRLAFRSSPVIEAYDADGNISAQGDEFNNQIDNPLLGTLNIRNEFVNQTLGNMYLKYDLTDWLSAKTTFGYTLRDVDEGIFVAPENVGSNGGSAFRESITSTNWVSTTQLDFNKTFGKHSLNAVVAGEAQRFKSSTFNASSQTFVTDILTFNNLQSGSSPLIPNSSASEWGIASFLGRVNYTFDNKYLFTVSGRYDGASRLAVGNKWNFFPSFAAKWKVANENFMADGFFETLNLGFSYGQTGNQGVAAFGTLPRLAPDQAIIGENSDINIGFGPANFANQSLTWENVEQLDFGVDFSILNGKLRFEGSYFTKDTEGLFFPRNLPAVVGTDNLSTVTNVGSLNNRGIEIDVNATIVDTKDFSWNINANFTSVRNEVLNLAESDTISSGRGGEVGFGTGSQLLIQGDRLGHFFGLQTDGLYDDDVSLTFNSSTRQPGDLKYVDTNGDGNVTPDDRVFLGYSIPDKFWGLTSTWKYKGISLSVLMQGSHGNKIANYTKYDLDNLSRSVNSTVAQLDRWTPTNTDTNVPRASLANQPYVFGDDLIEDGGYVRIKTITLGYQFPRTILDKLGAINSLNLYATGTNLFTFTDYSGINPDITATTGSQNQGYDDGGYPAAKSIVLGLNIGF